MYYLPVVKESVNKLVYIMMKALFSLHTSEQETVNLVVRLSLVRRFVNLVMCTQKRH
jgi:hypothetical protein